MNAQRPCLFDDWFSKTRAALAQGKEVCDRIAYEVNVAYMSIVDASAPVRAGAPSLCGSDQMNGTRTML